MLAGCGSDADPRGAGVVGANDADMEIGDSTPDTPGAPRLAPRGVDMAPVEGCTTLSGLVLSCTIDAKGELGADGGERARFDRCWRRRVT